MQGFEKMNLLKKIMIALFMVIVLSENITVAMNNSASEGNEERMKQLRKQFVEAVPGKKWMVMKEMLKLKNTNNDVNQVCNKSGEANEQHQKLF